MAVAIAGMSSFLDESKWAELGCDRAWGKVERPFTWGSRE